MLRYPHPVRAAAHDFGHFRHIQIGQYPQQDHLGLIRRQCRHHHLGGVLRRHPTDDVMLGIIEPPGSRRSSHCRPGACCDARHGVDDQPFAGAAIENTHARNAVASPTNRPNPVATAIHTSAARSSAAAGSRAPQKPHQPGMKIAEQHRHRVVVTGTRPIEKHHEIGILDHDVNTITPSARACRS